ncbi:TPA: DUF1024 family protein, partial [Staphylococcus aureus]|nr:DUF1024 family protein [Staphylococcus aureus]HDE9071289.1 DUF1024 family protein [Staphylococcus aureus]
MNNREQIEQSIISASA